MLEEIREGKKQYQTDCLFIYRFIDDFLISIDKVVYVQNNAGIFL